MITKERASAIHDSLDKCFYEAIQAAGPLSAKFTFQIVQENYQRLMFQGVQVDPGNDTPMTFMAASLGALVGLEFYMGKTNPSEKTAEIANRTGIDTLMYIFNLYCEMTHRFLEEVGLEEIGDTDDGSGAKLLGAPVGLQQVHAAIKKSKEAIASDRASAAKLNLEMAVGRLVGCDESADED